jgi:hypothetical protein
LRPQTLGNGSAYDLAFSHDAAQKYLLVADGENNVIWTLLRSDGSVVGTTGHAGRNAGQFHHVHVIVSDSKGNLYTGEVETGRRIQKFADRATEHGALRLSRRRSAERTIKRCPAAEYCTNYQCIGLW